MSEPLSAFFKLRIDRAGLVRWLDSPVVLASHWTDWREIGGQYYNHDVQDIRDFAEADLAGMIGKSDSHLSRFGTIRAAVRDIMRSAEGPNLMRAFWQKETRDFVAGSLTYAQNLIDYISFYAVARSAANFLAAEDHGIAVIHNYVWGRDRSTHSAMRLGPGARSAFMAADEKDSAGGVFLEMAEAMMSQDERLSAVVDELDGLK
jgi:hypothetical protein